MNPPHGYSETEEEEFSVQEEALRGQGAGRGRQEGATGVREHRGATAADREEQRGNSARGDQGERDPLRGWQEVLTQNSGQ